MSTLAPETRTNSHFMCGCGHYHYPSQYHPGTVVRVLEGVRHFGANKGPQAVVGQTYTVIYGGKHVTELANPDGGEAIEISSYSDARLEVVEQVAMPGYPIVNEASELPFLAEIPNRKDSLPAKGTQARPFYESWALNFAAEQLEETKDISKALAAIRVKLNQSQIGTELSAYVEDVWVQTLLG